MAITALHSSATALSALSTEIDIIANNLANANTLGFRASRANFEDLLYQEKSQPGVETPTTEASGPSGLYVGLGTRISNTQFDFSNGAAIKTNGPVDMMIDGPGLFQVRIADAQSETGIGYTRSGNFLINRDGNIVLGSSDGPLLDPPIAVPENTEKVVVSQDGIVNVQVRGESGLQQVGQLELANFVNPGGLRPLGGNLFAESASSGPPITGTPNEGSIGRILFGHLEASNVDSVRELVSLIKTQRAFEMNSQTIQTADEALQVISNLRRF